MGRILVFFVLIVLCLGVSVGMMFLDKKLAAEPEPTPAPVLVVDPGIVMPPSNIRGIVGPGDVYVHVTTVDHPYQVGVIRDDTGARHFWLPGSLPASLGSLNLEEGQEYVLRRLVACGTCNYDVSAEVLDPVLLQEMVGDPNIIRTSEPSHMVQLAFVNFAKYALDKQADVAKAGFNSNVAIAASGDAAVVGVESAHAAGQCAFAAMVIAVCAFGLYLVMKGKN